jgi:hypothetical protein
MELVIAYFRRVQVTVKGHLVYAAICPRCREVEYQISNHDIERCYMCYLDDLKNGVETRG